MSNFSKATEKAISALQKVEQSPAWKRAAAYVIIPPVGLLGPKYGDVLTGAKLGHLPYGKIKISYPADGMGKLQVFVWDCIGNDLQYGWASGCGYDKLSAALAGLKFDNITFTDHPVNWEMQLREAGYTVIQAI